MITISKKTLELMAFVAATSDWTKDHIGDDEVDIHEWLAINDLGDEEHKAMIDRFVAEGIVSLPRSEYREVCGATKSRKAFKAFVDKYGYAA